MLLVVVFDKVLQKMTNGANKKFYMFSLGKSGGKAAHFLKIFLIFLYFLYIM